MEVLHRRVEEEEEQLRTRRQEPEFADPNDYVSSDDTSSDGMKEESKLHENDVSPKSVYLDKNEGIWKCHHCIWTLKIGQPWTHHLHHKSFSQGSRDTKIQWSVSGEKLRAEDEVDISKLVNAVINRESIIGDFKGEVLSVSIVGGAEESVRMEVVKEESGEEEEEEEIELEFERAVDKLHTHTPFCPNCSNQITKVILRRKRRSSPRPDRPLNLLGCLSCFSIFIPSGDRLNPFGFFGSKPKIESLQVEDVQPSTDPTTIAAGNKHSLNPFNCFGYKPKQESPKIEESSKPVREFEAVGEAKFMVPTHDLTTESSKPVREFEAVGEAKFMVPTHDLTTESSKPVREFEAVGEARFMLPTHDVTIESSKPVREFETVGEALLYYPTHHAPVDIEAQTDTTTIIERGDINLGVGEQVQPLIDVDQRSIPFEILKCIVYGGLLQSIASLSVVSSAAASDATTLNVVTIGLTTVFSGLIAFGYRLLDLKDEVGSNEEYEEVLGRKGHFLFHSTFAIFSFIVFGLVAPITYGFAFRESNDKDYKIIAVAAAGFACVLILSIAKAYAKGADRLGSFVKTILYYVSMAVSVSGVAYAAGDLIGMLLDKYGWFESPQGLTYLVSPTPTWASY